MKERCQKFEVRLLDFIRIEKEESLLFFFALWRLAISAMLFNPCKLVVDHLFDQSQPDEIYCFFLLGTSVHLLSYYFMACSTFY